VSPLNRIPLYRTFGHQNRRSRSDVDRFRDSRLRKIVAHAYQNVPFYRSLFDAHGIRPGDIRGTNDLGRIPITTRSDIQHASLADRIAAGVDPKSLLEFRTTGSTGQCLVVSRKWREQKLLSLFAVRAMRSYGLRVRDVIGVPRVRVPTHPRDNQIPRRIADSLGLYRRIIVDPRSGVDQVKTLYDLGSEVIQGWPTVLAEIAPRWKSLRESRGMRKPVRFVLTGGEMLTAAAHDNITRGFDAPVYDLYGAHETSLVAWQCADSGEYHLSDETICAEVIRDGRIAEPGGTGEMVVTMLHSFAMPFIRYKLGDMVVQGSAICSCGSPFSTIRAIQGRTADFLSLPNGRFVHPQDIARDSYLAAHWIRQLQVVQQTVDRFELHVVPAREPSPAEIEAVRPAIAWLLGPGVSFDVVVVQSIDRTMDSKFRVYRSNLLSQELRNAY
jgi:phenylacetate-CoA ligase